MMQEIAMVWYTHLVKKEYACASYALLSRSTKNIKYF